MTPPEREILAHAESRGTSPGIDSKRTTMAEAIARFVPDGSRVVLGACLEAAIPFAAAHELIRQHRRNLTLIGPISDILFDQLIGAGCVDRVIVGWVGNVSAGLAHCFRRAVEQSVPRPLAVQDHSNLSLGLALLAAGLGAPFIPTRSLLGSDLPRHNPDLVPGTSPLDGSPLIFVRSLAPDVTILHVQKADEEGHAWLWGNLGVAVEAALAANRVLITAEEVVPGGALTEDPNRVVAPAQKVVAVVEAPGGAHPSPVIGYTERDHEFFHEYHRRSRTLEGFNAWLEEWVLGVPNLEAYRERLEARRTQSEATP
ncbi:MAG: CoA transferase subunit A [Thermoleophilia bacterium]